jgi:DMSO/TMAO reductase YedYZ molybdopterin-dependent catalytic subunit
VQWNLGGISSAQWTGVPLAHVLGLAGLEAEAVDVMFEGADSGEVTEGPKPSGRFQYARSLPRQKALDTDVLLAYAMNGEKLTPAHGFPLRLIVPSWYAVASVKWLTRIVAGDHPFQGYFQSIDYGYWDRSEGQPQRKIITEMLVKAQIAHPQMHEKVPGRSHYTVRGAAWSGAAKIARVEVSTDGGASWELANLTSESSTNLWCLWEYDWLVPGQPGERVLLARASDEKGNSQPLTHNQDRETYMINFCLPIAVLIE